MSDTTDRVVAIKAVIDRVQPDVAPTLTQGEIELEVDRARLVQTWQPNTAYRIGDVVVPEIRNGHSYVCVQPGTSQATARGYFDWPSDNGVGFGGYMSGGSCFSDGNSDPQLIWETCGTDRFNPGIWGAETNIYDIARAAQQCWVIKSRKTSQFVDDGDVLFEQMFKHCVAMANSFHPFRRQAQLVRT